MGKYGSFYEDHGAGSSDRLISTIALTVGEIESSFVQFEMREKRFHKVRAILCGLVALDGLRRCSERVGIKP